MSHFAVAIIHEEGQDIEKLLAPYDENLEVKPYMNRTRDMMVANGHRIKSRIRMEKLDLNTNQWAKKYVDAETDEDFWLAEKDEVCYTYDEKGNELTTYNPNSKWDWWCIGGRFSGCLKVWEDDESMLVSSAKVKSVDFTPDKEEYDKAYNWWVEHIDSDKEWDSFIKKEYYTDTYKDATDYATRCAQFSTFAVVTPDGVWHEKGEMGWFACSDETPEEARSWDENYYNTFIAPYLDGDYCITIVDCHI